MSSFRKLVIVKRKNPGNYNSDGIWVEGDESTIPVRMSIQPLRLEEMDALPEGRRSSKAMKIFADAELLCAEQSETQNADILIWQGKQWEVVACDAYQMGILPHFKALAVEVKAS